MNSRLFRPTEPGMSLDSRQKIFSNAAPASGGAVVVSQYIGSENRENADCSAGQLLTSAAVVSAMLTGQS